MTDKVQKIREEVEKCYNECLKRAKITDSDYWNAKADAYRNVLLLLDSVQEEPVSDRFAFKAIPRLLEMIDPTDRAKTYTAKLADTLEVEGYFTDAKIVRNKLRKMNGENVNMATMDGEPVSEDLNKAAEQDVCEVVNASSAAGIPNYHIPSWVQDAMINEFVHGAKWKEEQFEKNRLKHCNSITNEQAKLEQEFLDQHIKNNNRMPTFLDAIEYGAKWKEQQMMKEAVDGLVVCDELTHYYKDIAMHIPDNLVVGDKVKLIIIKND